MEPIDLTPLWAALRAKGIEPQHKYGHIELLHHADGTTQVVAGNEGEAEVWLYIDAAGNFQDK